MFTLKHASWDGGAVSENPFFLATIGPQKTIKTREDRAQIEEAFQNGYRAGYGTVPVVPFR